MAEKVIKGSGIGPGRAQGVLVCIKPPSSRSRPEETTREFKPESEYDRFRDHVSGLAEEMEEVAAELTDDAMHEEAEIFQAHSAILQDDEFHSRVRKAIRGLKVAAETAVDKVLEDMAEVMKETEDEVFAERAVDFRDLKHQLCQRLSGQTTDFNDKKLDEKDAPIVAIEEMTPSIVLKAQRKGARGFIVDSGTGYSHAAVLAKSFDECVLRVPSLESVWDYEGRHVLVDAMDGELLIEPTDEEKKSRPWPIRLEPLGDDVERFARLWVNILRPSQLSDFSWRQVEGVGLYRTETLFMERDREFPTEDEQYEVYAELFSHAEGKTVTVRTLDIGADKPAAYLWLGPQDNPQLGLRAHRIYHFHPEILVTQMRALLRAAKNFDHLRVMYPMIESIDQFEFVRGLTDHAMKTLRQDGIEFKEDFDQGVLVETPSAVWSFPTLIRASDFASVGTNDLVQYLFAVDRNAACVSSMYPPEHPIVFQVLKTLADQAAEAGKPISVCGEMAADLRAMPVLLGLGMCDLSVSPRAIPIVEDALRDHELAECHSLAERCLQCDHARDVEKILDDWMGVPHRPETPPERDIIDPVCKEKIDPQETTHVVSVGQVKYYFCSQQCQDTFVQWTPQHADESD